MPSIITINRVRKSFSEQRALAAVAVNIPLLLQATAIVLSELLSDDVRFPTSLCLWDNLFKNSNQLV